MMNRRTEDVLGEFGFRVLWETEECCAKATAYEIMARDGKTGEPLFDAQEDTENAPVQSLYDAEIYLTVLVKWDGCTHVNSPGYWHWCGPVYYRKHIALVEYLYRRAFELMGRQPDEAWDDASLPALELKEVG